MRSTKRGIFLGLRVKTIAAIGAYLQNNMPAFLLNAGTLAGTYRTPAIFVDITAVFTNTNPVRPYRGNGRPEAGYVIERMIDIAADELKIDPIEFRRRNYIPPLRCRSRPVSHSPTTAANLKRTWTWRWSCMTARVSSGGARIAQTRQTARSRYFQYHRTRGSGGYRRRRSAL